MKIYFKIFLFALLFNFIWENLHAPLYLYYRGGAITELVLLRAALIDALIILALVLAAGKQKKISQGWLIFIFGLIIAVVLERWALGTGRWVYALNMPIIPILNTGLTPTVQLGLSGWLSFSLVFKNEKREIA